MRRLLVVCEARADFEIATTLVDRCLQASSIDWLRDLLDPDIDLHRAWVGSQAPVPFVEWRRLKDAMRVHRIKAPRGYFDGKQHPDAMAARNALILARALAQQGALHGVLLVRDADAQPDRRDGLRKAREVFAFGLAVAVGVADRMIEAWVLAGFVPVSALERGLLEDFRQTLGFDPTQEPHRLRDAAEDGLRSPKRVVHLLTGADRDRWARCFRETSLEMLAERGEQAGLKDFLEDVRRTLEPLF